ncbi:interferon-induced, double-stranded RNA-activated protein kinase [Sylvia atricapilla]|uniref:interferon-induced, double-stranded RNA-activated protein kinase n=1 Tax=Sylvia atricapilla TaxID=48155 RepID=UPI0033945382
MDCEYVTRINRYCQIHKFTMDFDTIGRKGPSHDPEFTVVVKINGKEHGRGTGKSKREAKAVAAKETWEMIEKQEKSLSNMAAAESTAAQTTSSPALDKDYVSLLNMFSQKMCLIVDYPNQTCTGDAHAPTYFISCTISGRLYGKGTGPSRAAAKQAAAKEAYEKIENESSNGSWRPSNSSNVSQVSTESDSEICFEDSSAKLVQKMEDMAICEKPSPLQKNARSSVSKPVRKLAATFGNVRNKEEEKKVSDSKESLPHVDRNTGEDNANPHTVDETFLNLFEKIEPIGAGGFGNVFKATSKSDKKTYAIKRVELTEKVEREAEGLSELTHENIVRYHCSWKGYDHIKYPDLSQNFEFSEDRKTSCLFIQMEFCEQGTLSTWIAKNREKRNYHAMALNKFLQIVKGVEYIHSKELIHRDLKPQNIFISHDDKIKIGDFGLVTSMAFETLTEERGTKFYMAPEQFGAKYGKEVDIYALGLIWYEILSACSYHERSKVWPDVRNGVFSESFTKRFPSEVWDFNIFFC